MDAPHQVVIHRSINRPHLLLGADRESVLIAALASTALGYSMLAVSMIGVFCAGLLWVVCVFALRRIAAVDPLMWRVYARHIRYGTWYPARSGIDAEPEPLPARWMK